MGLSMTSHVAASAWIINMTSFLILDSTQMFVVILLKYRFCTHYKQPVCDRAGLTSPNLASFLWDRLLEFL